MKLCWQKEAPIGIFGIWSIEYGYDDFFKFGFKINKVSISASIFGYWVGISCN